MIIQKREQENKKNQAWSVDLRNLQTEVVAEEWIRSL